MVMDLDAVDWWSFSLVRDALADALALWRRSPGDGRSPYSTDGPWHLMLREVAAGDYDARGGFLTSSDVDLRPLPLSREEVAFRDRVSDWLGHVAKAEDRKLIVVACGYYAIGYQQVPWRRIKHVLAIPRGEAGLRKRFERAIAAIAVTLNDEIRSTSDTQGGAAK
jgi:hypothetical protein